LLTPQESHDQAVVAGDADRDLERRSFMVAARMNAECQRLAIGRSAAGVPRTFRRLPAKHHTVRAFLARPVGASGSLLNSVMVAIGDKLGLYKTGQYSVDAEDDSPSR
jgi:hypothetical protein